MEWCKNESIIQIKKDEKFLKSRAGPVSSEWSPRPFACDKDEHPADGDEAVLEWGHGEDGELGPIL